ncbi:MAG: ATP-binding protein [Ruminococcaceae bacterium]|nr:ATP-binding protein [Oscillospiraceae bacterium]
MNQSIYRRLAAQYDLLRQEAINRRESEQAAAWEKYPELARLDREIAIAGADLLLETIDPSREPTAAARKAALQAEREAFLKAAGLPLTIGEVVYNCAACQDTGIIDKQRCHCYRARLIPLLSESANLNHLRAARFENFDEQLFSDQPDPRRYQSELSPRTSINGIRQACERFVQDFKQAQTRNLFFVGKPGTGKTYLMACVGHAMIEQGRTVLYLPAAQLFDALAEYRILSTAYNPDELRFERSTALQEAIFHCELLLIDDLGTEFTSAARYPELLQVLDQRTGTNRRTIISSNVEASLIRELYDERLLSRLYGGFAVYRFIGEDVRFVLNQRRRQGTTRDSTND